MYGSSTYYLFVNLNAWSSLSKSQQAILVNEGKKMGAFWDPEWLRLAKVEQEKLVAGGSRVTEPRPELRGKLSAAWASGLWALADQMDAKSTEELRAFVKAKGLEP